MHAPEFEAEVQRCISEKIAEHATLSYTQAIALPECVSNAAVIAREACTLSVFMQSLQLNRCILVVQLSIPGMRGLASRHWERGLIFSSEGRTREATELELRNTGG